MVFYDPPKTPPLHLSPQHNTSLTEQELLLRGALAHGGEVADAGHFVLVALAGDGREDADLLAAEALPYVVEFARFSVDHFEVVAGQS